MSVVNKIVERTNKMLAVLVMTAIAAACTDDASIGGKIANAENELLELSLNIAPFRTLDTVRLKAEGRFAFKYEFKNEYPVFLLLNIVKNKERIPIATLLLERGEKVHVDSDLAHRGEYTVNGSKGSALVKELNAKMLAVVASYDSLNRIVQNASERGDDATAIAGLNRETASLFIKYKQWLIKFVVNNCKSYAAYMAMYQRMPNGFALFGKDQDAVYYKMLADSIDLRYPKSIYAKQLREDYKVMANALTLQNLLENAEEIAGIPDVRLPDMNGREVALSECRGKTTLLSFWTPDDKGLLMDNMELLDLYARFKDKGFEIYQVSLGLSRELWLQTIGNQGLQWISVSDMKGGQSPVVGLYNVKKLPANFLIGRDGELIAKDVFGKTLEQNLEKIFKDIK